MGESRDRDAHNRKKQSKRVVRMYYAETETLGDPLKTLAVDDKEVSDWQFVHRDSIEKRSFAKWGCTAIPAYGFRTKSSSFERFKPSNTRSWEFLMKPTEQSQSGLELPGL